MEKLDIFYIILMIPYIILAIYEIIFNKYTISSIYLIIAVIIGLIYKKYYN